MRSLAWLLIGIALMGPANHFATAMGIRSERVLLTRGPGGAALYEIREWGPEGGGALSFRIELSTKRSRAPLTFMVSSDFSPGNGSQPQTISPATCAERLAALGAAVTKHRIPGVTVHPERCKNEEREGVVVVTTGG